MKKQMALLFALVMLFSMTIIFAGCEGVTPKTATSPQQDDDYELEDEEEEEKQQGDAVTNALQLAKEAYENYIAVAYQADASLLEQIAPAVFWEYHEYESLDGLKEALPAAIEKYLERQSDQYGNNIQTSFKIKNFDSIENFRFIGIANSLAERYGLDASLVQNGIQLTVELTVAGDAASNTQTSFAFVICYDGGWYYLSGASRSQDDGTFSHDYQFAADYVLSNIRRYLDEAGQNPSQEQETPVVTDPQSALENYYRVYFIGDKNGLEACAPKEVWEIICGENSVESIQLTMDDLKLLYSEYMSYTAEELKELGTNVTLHVEVSEIQEMDSFVHEVSGALEAQWNLDRNLLTQVSSVSCSAILTGDNQLVESGNWVNWMICYDGVWYPVEITTGRAVEVTFEIESLLWEVIDY